MFRGWLKSLKFEEENPDFLLFRCSSGGWLLSKFTSQSLLPKPAESWIYYPQFIRIHIPLSVGGSGGREREWRGTIWESKRSRNEKDERSDWWRDDRERERGVMGGGSSQLPACRAVGRSLDAPPPPDVSDRSKTFICSLTVTDCCHHGNQPAAALQHAGNHGNSRRGSRGWME